MELSQTTLTLFFTGGVGLKTWARVGNLEREIVVYQRLAECLKAVNFVTYGGHADYGYANSLGSISLYPVSQRGSMPIKLAHLLIRHWLMLLRSDVFKSNQIQGSEIPLWFKKHFGKKLIVRCGYLQSNFIKNQTKDGKRINSAIRLEKKAFSFADMGIVTSSWQRDIVINQYNVDPEKIKVIPNYVVTDVFKPHPEIQKKYDLIFVGRAGNQKNIGNLLKAIHYLKTKRKHISLLMVGGCCQDNKIKKTVNNYALDATFKGNIPNFRLPHILNQVKVFILPSYYEGHPKTLLEAMSCGLPCIGSNIIGIREDIEHMKSGYLCKTDYESIANAIETLLSDEWLQKTIGNNAREYILRKYTVEQILKMELDVIQEVIAG